MAIVDSIALGKSKGSIGNITFYQLNGQTVARYRNTAPTDPQTPAQLSQRLGMKNTTKAFSLMKEWAKGLAAVKVGKQTYYNRFTSIMIKAFNKVNYSTPLDIIKGVIGGGIVAGNSIYVLRNELKETYIRIPFDTAHYAYETGWKMVLGVINDSEDSFDTVSENISLTDWNNGYIDVPIIGSKNYKTFCYAYNPIVHKISDITLLYLLSPEIITGVKNIIFSADGVVYPSSPVFTPTFLRDYSVATPSDMITANIEWANPADEKYIIYNNEVVEQNEANVYTFDVTVADPTLVLDVLPALGAELEYVFLLSQY